MNGFFQDVRYALRQLRKNPGRFSIIVLTIGLGIGVNAAIFSMVDWLVLRSLPIEHPEQVHFLAFSQVSGNSEDQFSYTEFAEIQKQTTNVFSDITPFIFGGLEGSQTSQNGLTADGVTKPVQTVYVSGDFFSMLGITPAVGRFILRSEERTSDVPPIVLSYNYWHSRFNNDLAIIGKAVLINGHSATVVGIAPKGFLGPTPIIETQAYLPLTMYSMERGVLADFLTNPKVRNMLIFARVKSGVNAAQVQSVLTLVGKHLLERYPRAPEIRELRAQPLRPPGIMNSPGTNPLLILATLFLFLAALVLSLACINVANLFLARAIGRQREMAVRAALGAARGRLVRQLLTEGFVVATLGYIVGVLFGLGATRLLTAVPIQSELPFTFDFDFDWRVFAYAFAVAIVTGVAVVVLPAIRIRRGNLRDILHEGGRTTVGVQKRLRSVMAAIQVAGSLTLLIVAGLFVRSLRNVQNTNLGFDPRPVLNVTLDPNEIGYTEAQGRAFYRALIERVRALPGVESASLASTVPLGDSIPGTDLAIQGYRTLANQPAPHAEYNAISSGYFKTMGMVLLHGRDLTDADNENSLHIAVINQAMADRYWPGQDAIGRSFAMTSDAKHLVTIVGVVENSRMSELYGPFDPVFYLPIKQSYTPVETLQVRTERSPEAILPEIRAVAQSSAPAVPLYGVRTMVEALHGSNGLLPFELGASLALALGLLGVVLAIVGVYGLMSYMVSQRTREIGIRIALGAHRSDILKMIGFGGLLLVAVGMTVGLLAAFAVGHMFGDFLVGITPNDPITYLGVSFLLMTVASLAMYIPARRATRVDPMVALRYE